MLVDSHCHLNLPEFSEDRNDVIANAKKAGVKWFVVPGDDWKTSTVAIELAQARPECFRAAVGYHPYETQHHPAIGTLDALAKQPGVVAIGEIGLDYHLYKGFPAEGKKDEQKTMFEGQLLTALHHNLPVIIHCRDAYMDVFDVLDSLPSMPRGVFHCFSGSVDDLEKVKARGMFVGFDGNITYSKSLKALLPAVPLSMMLLETDAPYLTPEPNRGKRNEPKYLTYTAKAAAELTGIPLPDIHAATTANAKLLFGLP
jgi:TatD DNase family protein